MLGVVGCVTHHDVEAQSAPGLPHRRTEVGRVVARPAAHDGGRDQVGAHVSDSGEFRPEALLEQGVAAAANEVRTDVSGLEPRRVDRPLRSRVDQAENAGASENGVEKLVECPPFKRRCSA